MRLFSKTPPLTNGLDFKKWCCDKPTHFPKKMIGCEDWSHDIAARLGQASALDAIITVGPLTVSNEIIFDPIYDHAAIQCNVNGLTLFSLNLEGCCNKRYNKNLQHDRWNQLKEMIKGLHPFPDIFCFQELFLRSNMPDPKDRRLSAVTLMQELLDTKQSNFIYIYDDFTGGTIVNKKCIHSDQSVYYPDIHLTDPVKFIARYKDINKKCTMVHVYKGETSFYVVNVHLKAIQTSIAGNSFHKKEVANLLAHLKEEMKVGIVFIGDHNTTQPLKLYTQAGGTTRSKKLKKNYTRKASGGNKYVAPILLELPIDDPIITFSENIKQQLIDKIKEKYDKIGWFRKKVVATSPSWFTSNFIVNPKLIDILPLVSQQLNKHGLHVKEKLMHSDILVEIEYANAEAKPIKSEFIIHTDNHGGIRGKVHTLMVFLDMECRGGEVAFYSPKKEFIDSFGESKNSKSKNSKSKNKVLMYDGGLYNNPMPITDGKRVVVTYQIRQDE